MSNIGKPLRIITVEPLEMPEPLRREVPEREPQKVPTAPEREPVLVPQR